ncbi:MAG: hypothetical protein ACAI35_25340, partial [Candidatus Methylacidiphilales bacterium]
RIGTQAAKYFLEIPEFCMTQNPHVNDPRLDLNHVVFIASSNMPGEDVLVAIDLRGGDLDPQVLVFDWDKAVPNRWVERGTLSQLIQKLEMNSTSQP